LNAKYLIKEIETYEVEVPGEFKEVCVDVIGNLTKEGQRIVLMRLFLIKKNQESVRFGMNIKDKFSLREIMNGKSQQIKNQLKMQTLSQLQEEKLLMNGLGGMEIGKVKS